MKKRIEERREKKKKKKKKKEEETREEELMDIYVVYRDFTSIATRSTSLDPSRLLTAFTTITKTFVGTTGWHLRSRRSD